MLDSKEIRMLELLDEMILNCKKCSLHSGGKVLPYWTTLSKYVIIGEAPGREEVENNEPFVGTAGGWLWKAMNKYGFRKEEFLIINSVQCRPTNGRKNLKPDIGQINTCRHIWKKYIKVLNPYRMLVLGNYAMGAVTGEYKGILNKNSRPYYSRTFESNFIASVHPSYCIYNGQDGYNLLKKSIKIFRKWGSEEYEDFDYDIEEVF